jgi:membrane protease YdiL (CAAX protease family)
LNDIQPDRNTLFFGDEGLRAGWSLLLYIALLAALFFTSQHIAGLLHHAPAQKSGLPHEQSPLSLLIGESVPFLLVVFASWIMSRIEQRPSGDYGLGGSYKLSRFLAGTGWGFVFLSLLVLTLKLTGLLVFDSRLLHGSNILRYSLIWIVGFLVVALLEEYLLRGYLQFTLTRGLAGIYEALNAPNSRALSFWTAALLLSCIFGFGHRSNPGESPIGLFAAAIAGLVFCLSLWRTGSLWWAIGFHASWDWAQSFLYGVADSGTMVQFHLFATHPVGKPLLSGGATGPEGSIFILPVMALIATAILFTLPRLEPEPTSNYSTRGAS